MRAMTIKIVPMRKQLRDVAELDFDSSQTDIIRTAAAMSAGLRRRGHSVSALVRSHTHPTPQYRQMAPRPFLL